MKGKSPNLVTKFGDFGDQIRRFWSDADNPHPTHKKKLTENLVLSSFICNFAPEITKVLTSLWTITRRIITNSKGGGWRARQLIPLPLKFLTSSHK